MSIIAKVSPSKSTYVRARVDTTEDVEVKAVYVNSARLASLADLDMSTAIDGGLIQYVSSTQSFKIQPILEHPNLKIIGGSF